MTRSVRAIALSTVGVVMVASVTGCGASNEVLGIHESPTATPDSVPRPVHPANRTPPSKSLRSPQSAGGTETGEVTREGTGKVNGSSHWPDGTQNGQTAFHNGQVNQQPFQPDSGGTFMRLPDGVSGFDYVFGTPLGVFAVDTPNGAIMSFEKAATKDFTATNAGTYKAIFYRKVNASTGVGNVESGTASQGGGTVTITSTGDITVTDAGSTVLAAGTLVPVADQSYLVGTGKLSDPCNGMFTIRSTTASSQQDLFCTFLNGAVLFSSYKTVLPLSGSNTYEYFYGCGLK